MAFHAYLFFSDGQCRDAFTRYAEVFGGSVEIMTNADLPPDAEPMPGAEPHHVMHAALTLDGGGLLMGSDDPTGDGGPRVGVAVSYSTPDVPTGERVFAALCEGGEEQMAFSPTFWSPGFGACVDRFGVPWMVDVETPDQP
jgi:PhnB protein